MIHPSLREYEISLLLKESQPKIFVTQWDLYEKNVRNLIVQFPLIQHFYLIDLPTENSEQKLLSFSDLILDSVIEFNEVITGEQDATIFDTSGSTGKSKCVLNNHQSILTMIDGYDRFHFNDESVFLLVNSMNICIGFYATILPAIKCGASIYYFSSNLLYNDYIKTISQILYRETITYLCITTSAWQYILDELKNNYTDIHNHVRLRYCLFCGEKCSPLIYEKTKDYLGFYPIEAYGMTECDIIGIAPFEEHEKVDYKPHVGTFQAFGDKQIRITNCDNWECLPINTLGEITIQSKALMTGYFNDEQTTKQVLRDDCFKTGDIGYIDENDCFHISGRKKFHIIFDGFNINLVELETILRQYENINEVCITSIKSGHDYETPVAYITLKQSHDDHAEMIKQIFTYLSDKVATYKIPKYMKILSQLPKSSKTGKVDRQLLSKMALEDFGTKSS